MTCTSNNGNHDAFRDQDPTPKPSNDPWRFTPSLMDPNSFSFANFANAPPGYYTPTPGGTNTIYHPQAGDLHTPTMGVSMGLGTPLSMPTSEGTTMPPTASMMDISAGFQTLQNQQFPQFNTFIQPPQQQAAFAPASFVHQETGYETMEHDGSPMDSGPSPRQMTSLDGALHHASPMVGLQQRQFNSLAMTAPLPSSAEKFRFHATLNAPTAMIKHADEIPVTYLNKGQAYSISIVDTHATLPLPAGTKYRTYIRISFEEEQQRLKPASCWSLWKEGRGTNEAHQRGGRLQAVEFVEAKDMAREGDDKRTRVELESSSFDGFSVIWTPAANGSPDCNIAVRFNFLSTDFSHSKGVKGIPVRLCAKTNPVTSDSGQPGGDKDAAEICYCKVKLFRDHGAERKLANDVAHVKKSTDKLKQQIAQAESGLKDVGKRKRSSASQAKTTTGEPRHGKVPKHKRTWSMSSASSAGGGRPPIEEELHFKLQTLQDMFTSTRPVSVLYLRSDELDDADLHPISLSGDPNDPMKAGSREGAQWQVRSGHSSLAGSSLVSPSPSSLSLASQASTAANRQWAGFDGEGSGEPASRQGSDQPTKVPKLDESGNLSGWIEALGVDPTYQSPPDRVIKPVACFYVLRRDPSSQGSRQLYKAIYLAQRTVKEFNLRVAMKWNLDQSKILRTLRVLQNGLEVEVDDEVVRELREGQDLVLEVAEMHPDGSDQVKQEWEMAVDQSEAESGLAATSRAQAGYELRLKF